MEKKNSPLSYFIPKPLVLKEVYTIEDLYDYYYDHLLRLNTNKAKKTQLGKDLDEVRKDGEDITQEIFTRIVESYSSLDHSNIAGCISLIARNAFFKWKEDLHRKGFDPRAHISMADERFSFVEPESNQPDPLLNMLIQESFLCVQLRMDEFSQKDLEIFYAKYWEGKRSKEIAEEFGMKPNALNTRLHRMRAHLASCSSREDYI